MSDINDTVGSAPRKPDLSGLIGGLLSDPAALRCILSMLSGLGFGSTKPDPPSPGACCQSDGCSSPGCGFAPGCAPAPGCGPAPGHGSRGGDGGHPKKGSPDDNRRALLIALRPYLNEQRRHTLDILIQLSSLLGLLQGGGGCGKEK